MKSLFIFMTIFGNMYTKSLLLNLSYHFTLKFQHAFSCESSDGLPERKYSHTCCTCLAFLHCAFSNDLSKHVHMRIHNHTGCICLTFLHCVFSNVASNRLPELMQSRIGCICLTFLHCVFSNVSSKC